MHHSGTPQSKAIVLMKQYETALVLMEQDAKKAGYTFFSFVYIRTADSIKHPDARFFVCQNNLGAFDEYWIQQHITEMFLPPDDYDLQNPT